MILDRTDKQAILVWEDFLDSIRKQTAISAIETDKEKAERIKQLEAPGNHEAWFKYYFPNYCFCDPAAFQKLSTNKVLAAHRLYQRRAWARGLAKSTRRMFEILYKKFVHKWKMNMLLISHSESNAIRLLAPYRANLEANQRLINDYGTQIRLGAKWAEDESITRDGSSFRAVGAGQNPRGARLEELRVNVLLFDDIDSDEVCENAERLDKLWNWVEAAAIPTVEMSKEYLICFDNNIISEDSIAVRAGEKASDAELINWRDEFGRSTWIEKNKEADIDEMESFLSYETVQKEGYNNPISQGKTFKEMKYGKCPAKKKVAFFISYADPATSNNDKPTIKSKARNSCKVTVLMAYHDMVFYIYKCFVEHTSSSKFIDGMYAIRDHVKGESLLYSYIENNSLQNPFYEQVFLPLIFQKAKTEKIEPLLITPDDRDKPEKWARIEANLEPLNRLGLLILNIDEKNDPHMKRLEKQFLTAKPTSKELGAPDAVEGAVHILKNKILLQAAGGIRIFKKPRNAKRM